MKRSAVYPFTAIVGQEDMKLSVMDNQQVLYYVIKTIL